MRPADMFITRRSPANFYGLSVIPDVCCLSICLFHLGSNRDQGFSGLLYPPFRAQST